MSDSNCQTSEARNTAVNRSEAFKLLTEFTKSDALIKHALAVEAALRWYARYYGEDEELWGATGLLHDFDYERYPDIGTTGHPFMGCKELEQRGYPAVMIEAILGHATFAGVKRETQLAKSLFACDELVGLITASVFVRPDRSIHTLEAKSVIKKMKDKAFSRGVNRDDIRLGTEELGLELTQHVTNVIEAMRGAADQLGLAGNPSKEGGNG
jgi:putative nucleotidyltransferase with HDIG domain